MPTQEPTTNGNPVNLAKASVGYSGPQYLKTNEELYAVAIANLGSMNLGTYDSFMEQALEVAEKHGITKPTLVIDVSLKRPNIYISQGKPYPISPEEWDNFVRDAATIANFMPSVYVVDRAKYTASI